MAHLFDDDKSKLEIKHRTLNMVSDKTIAANGNTSISFYGSSIPQITSDNLLGVKEIVLMSGENSLDPSIVVSSWKVYDGGFISLYVHNTDTTNSRTIKKDYSYIKVSCVI